MKLIMKCSMEGPLISLVPGQVHDTDAAEAIRFVRAEIAAVHPDSEQDFAAALAEHEAREAAESEVLIVSDEAPAAEAEAAPADEAPVADEAATASKKKG